MAPDLTFSERVQAAVLRLEECGVAALGALFDVTSQRLVRFATTIVRNQHDGEDAVQAALVQVAQYPQRLIHAKKPWLYLLQMVHNEALAAARKTKRWRLESDLSDLTVRHAMDQADQEESFRAIWRALRKLPTEQAEVIVLKIWENLTFAQIGEILSLSPSTVASRYRYGMEKLAALLHVERPENAYDRS